MRNGKKTRIKIETQETHIQLNIQIFHTNCSWMPSCMELCFVHRIVRNPLVAIRRHHQHCDCVERIDPNTGNDHLHSFQYNGHSLELPRCQETVYSGTFHSCIRVGFWNRAYTATPEWLAVQQKLNYHRYNRNPRWPDILPWANEFHYAAHSTRIWKKRRE